MTAPTELTAARLRADFDRQFAEAAALAHAPTRDLLAARVGGDPYALPLAEVRGLYAHLWIEPVPGRQRGLLGIAALQGELLPVFDLAAVLGVGADPAPRWVVLVGDEAPVGLAFEALEGFLRVRADAVSTSGANSERAYVEGLVRDQGAVARPVLRLAAVRDALSPAVASAAPRTEP